MNPVSVKITYKLTEKDVREALVRHKGLGAKVTTIVGLFTCLMGALAFALDSTHSLLALIPFLFGALMLSLPWLQAQQMFREGGSPLRDEVTAEISDSGFFGGNFGFELEFNLGRLCALRRIQKPLSSVSVGNALQHRSEARVRGWRRGGGSGPS